MTTLCFHTIIMKLTPVSYFTCIETKDYVFKIQKRKNWTFEHADSILGLGFNSCGDKDYISVYYPTVKRLQSK